VLGSRKAELVNLDFFDSGGIPPVIVFLNGGSLSDGSRKRLESIFASNNSHRAAVVEVQSMGGSIDKPGASSVRVERFGSEKAQDSMFETYDSKCEERIRSAFRLPPLLLGKAEGYTFATAYASYVTAEAQVFVPERLEFDNLFNSTVMREMAPGYELVSKGQLPTDVELQLRGLGLAKDVLTGESIVDAVSSITGLSMEYSEEAEELYRGKPEETNTESVTSDGGRDSNTEGDSRPPVAGDSAGVSERNGSGSASPNKK
jgi:hypothetical protein